MKRRLLIFWILATAAVLPTGNTWAAAHIGLGVVELTAETENTTVQDLALKQALVACVAQELVKVLGEKRLDGTLQLIAQPILTDPSPFVSGYAIRSRTETEDRLYLLVSANINTQALQAALKGVGLGRASMKLRLLPLFIIQSGLTDSYSWWTSPTTLKPESTTADSMLTRLKELGISVMMTDTDNSLPMMTPEPTTEQATAMGRHYGAELVLMGRIVEMISTEGEVARLSCWVLDVIDGSVVAGPLDMAIPEPVIADLQPDSSVGSVDTSKLAQAIGLQLTKPEGTGPETKVENEAEPSPGSDSQTKSSPPSTGSPQPAMIDSDSTDDTSIKEPVEVMPPLGDPNVWPQPVPAREAGIRMAELLAQAIQNAGWVLPIKPKSITMEVEGVKRYTDLKVLLNGLKRFPDQVRNIRQQSIRAGKVTFKAMLLTTMVSLTDLIESQDFPTFFATVTKTDSDTDTLLIQLIPK